MDQGLHRLADAGLVLGATLRLTRLVTTDDLGRWWLRDPLDVAKHRWMQRHRTSLQPRWGPYLDGLDCPFCVGFWVGAAVLAVTAGLPEGSGPGRAWRFGLAALSLNEAVGHLAQRLGDVPG